MHQCFHANRIRGQLFLKSNQPAAPQASPSPYPTSSRLPHRLSAAFQQGKPQSSSAHQVCVCTTFAGFSLAKSNHVAKPIATVGGEHRNRQRCHSVSTISLFGNKFHPPNSKMKSTVPSTFIAHFMWSHVFPGIPKWLSVYNAQQKFFVSTFPIFLLPLSRALQQSSCICFLLLL